MGKKRLGVVASGEVGSGEIGLVAERKINHLGGGSACQQVIFADFVNAQVGAVASVVAEVADVEVRGVLGEVFPVNIGERGQRVGLQQAPGEGVECVEQRSVAAILFLMLWYLIFYGPFRIAETIVAAVR